MKKYILILSISLFLISCKKRKSEFSFAGVWEITKVEQVSYRGDLQILDSVIQNDTLGWFGLQNATGFSGQGKIQINFTSFSGLSTDYVTFWTMDEHNANRIEINDRYYTRKQVVGGEQWTWVTFKKDAADYDRETIFVKRK